MTLSLIQCQLVRFDQRSTYSFSSHLKQKQFLKLDRFFRTDEYMNTLSVGIRLIKFSKKKLIESLEICPKTFSVHLSPPQSFPQTYESDQYYYQGPPRPPEAYTNQPPHQGYYSGPSATSYSWDDPMTYGDPPKQPGGSHIFY